MSQQINLYNPAFRRQKRHFSAATMLQVLGVLIAALVVIYQIQARQNVVLERVLAETDRQLTGQRERMLSVSKQLGVSTGPSPVLAAELARSEERLRTRQALLGEVQTGAGGNAGFSPYLAALARGGMAGLWLTHIELGGKANGILIRGRVVDSELVAAYLRRLNEQEPFAGRTVRELRLVAREEKEKGAPGPQRFVEFTMSLPL